MSPAPALLLDVEGTTTPISFVSDVLFPFARARLRGFLEAHGAEPDVAAQLEALARDRLREPAGDAAPPWDAADRLGSACAYLEWQMQRDRKTTPLKTLQGRIWEDGFRSGALVAPVYADVPEAFRRWRAAARPIAIFSSGSVLAQRLLFAHTDSGDLSGFLSAHFDTTSGPKREADSYDRIARAMRRAPAEVLFVSDVAAELDAARRAGLATALCVRPGQAEPAPGPHPVIRSFAGI